jgi:hypothetical protein
VSGWSLTVDEAVDWWGHWRHIEEGLARVDARLTADLRTQLDLLRDSAAELLGLDLAVPGPGGRLGVSRRFFFTTAEDVGQTELLAGAIRRRLPGELGRRPAREHLRGEAPGLLASQIGRARADLQYRLAEATRALAWAVEQRYADGTQRLQTALGRRQVFVRRRPPRPDPGSRSSPDGKRRLAPCSVCLSVSVRYRPGVRGMP